MMLEVEIHDGGIVGKISGEVHRAISSFYFVFFSKLKN